MVPSFGVLESSARPIPASSRIAIAFSGGYCFGEPTL